MWIHKILWTSMHIFCGSIKILNTHMISFSETIEGMSLKKISEKHFCFGISLAASMPCYMAMNNSVQIVSNCWYQVMRNNCCFFFHHLFFCISIVAFQLTESSMYFHLSLDWIIHVNYTNACGETVQVTWLGCSHCTNHT